MSTSSAVTQVPALPLTRVAQALRRALPRGHSLPEDSWDQRHRWIMRLLWAHTVVVPFAGVLAGEPLRHALSEGAAVTALAAVAVLPRLTRTARAVAATLGLFTAAAVLTHFTGGLIELHFYFFVMVVIASLYHSWVPFLVGLGFVVTHHGVVGALQPESVYNHPAALAHPWRWAAVHGGFVVAQSIACLVAWRLNEDALSRERSARRQLEKANLDLAEAQALSGVGSWEWDYTTGDVWWSAELYKICGVTPDTFVPTVASFLRLVHPDDRDLARSAIKASTANGSPMEFEARIVTPAGDVKVVHSLGECTLAPDGRLQRVVGTCQDISERKHLEEEIQHRAFHDTLTGLANRALFVDRVRHALAMSERSAAPVTVLYLDLDDFKTINDSLGHTLGDDLLIEVAARLRASVRASDTVARLGGDEFALLLEDTDVHAAREAAQRIRSRLRHAVRLQGREVFIRASIGIASAAPHAEAGELLRDADIAMYAAKHAGKDGHEVFQPSMLSSAVSRMDLQAELTRAIAEQQFVLHFQPVVDLETQVLQAVEALVRWNHPQRGLVAPDDFIPLAEETGLIVELGAWVMREATLQTKTLQERLGVPVTVNVNLSVRQLSSDVVTMVTGALDAAGLDPRCLVLEITETALMSQEHEIVSQLGALRALGVRVAIDDFGTGYSSLAYLQRLPIDVLKIDRSFVRGVTQGKEDAALAQAIIRLARVFDLRTVAEGVETDAQADALRYLECQSAQGFLFCRPMPMGELLDHERERTATAAAAMQVA